jgi:hypothetical protein
MRSRKMSMMIWRTDSIGNELSQKLYMIYFNIYVHQQTLLPFHSTEYFMLAGITAGDDGIVTNA